jgi:AraC family transcriptional regulator
MRADFSASLVPSAAGLVEMPARPWSLVCLHVGPTVPAICRRDGRTHHGDEVHGDIEIIPAGTPSGWEIRRDGTTLVMRIPPALITEAAEAAGVTPSRLTLELVNRFTMRDVTLERLGWAVKAEIEAGHPNGRLFFDSLGTAIANELVRRHSTCASAGHEPPIGAGFRLSGAAYRRVIAYIEDHIDGDLSLADIAAVAGVSVSHFKVLFRRSTGRPVHQYVIDRRVDRAAALLRAGRLPISDVALATGFAHQSHLARHLRRALGVTPRTLRRIAGGRPVRGHDVAGA